MGQSDRAEDFIRAGGPSFTSIRDPVFAKWLANIGGGAIPGGRTAQSISGGAPRSKTSQVQDLASRGSGKARKGQGGGTGRTDFQGTKRSPTFRIGGSPGLSPNRYGGGVG
jgi:hypothetical protein